jgi:hypothetical protein
VFSGRFGASGRFLGTWRGRGGAEVRSELVPRGLGEGFVGLMDLVVGWTDASRVGSFVGLLWARRLTGVHDYTPQCSSITLLSRQQHFTSAAVQALEIGGHDRSGS